MCPMRMGPISVEVVLVGQVFRTYLFAAVNRDSIDPPRNFHIGTDERIRALAIGAPAWSVRKRRIEDTEAKWVETLAALRVALVALGRSDEEIERELGARAAKLDYAKLNALVALHNRWYPVEANLRMDPRSGAYLVAGRPWQREAEYTPERILELVRSR
jgi:hypothetical protein